MHPASGPAPASAQLSCKLFFRQSIQVNRVQDGPGEARRQACSRAHKKDQAVAIRHLEVHMQEVEQVSSLIGDIYDAALDPRLWATVLRRAREFVGGSAAALFSKDATRKILNVYYDDGGLDPHYKQLYFDKYVKLDP